MGNGLAGTLLSYLIRTDNIPHIVISDSKIPSASAVSAGMINPLVFKRITLSWQADKLIPFAYKFYKTFEDEFNCKIYTPRKIAKVISSEEEYNWWLQRINTQNLKPYIDDFIDGKALQGVNNVYKFAIINNAAHVNINKIIPSYFSYANNEDLLIKEEFEYSHINFTSNGVSYKNITAKKIVFCEGAHIVNNPYFNFIPFYLTRGDLIKVNIPELSTEYIVNKNKFILPIDNSYLFGSTYIPSIKPIANFVNDHYNTLKQSLSELLNVPYEITEHTYGVRPTIKDRRPVLGHHPMHKQLYVFNGLGTKGAMLAPYFAHMAKELLTKSNSVADEALSINRFYSS